MTVIIKSNENKEKIAQALKDGSRNGKFKAFDHCGKLVLNGDPLEIQKKLRDEWR